MSKLWCFDPGQTTGVAAFDLDESSLINSWDIIEAGNLDEYFSPGDVVVFEQITWRSPSFNPIGLEVTGVIKFFARKEKCEIVSQTPGQTKGIQKWPIFNFSLIKSQHRRDAICHGIAYFLARSINPILPDELRGKM